MNFCRLNKSLFLLLISSSPRVPLLCKFTPQRASISVILFKIPSSLGLILSSVRSWTRRPSFQDVCVGCEEFWGRKKGPLHADSSVWPAFNVPSATAIRWSPTAEAAAFVEILHLLIEGEGGCISAETCPTSTSCWSWLSSSSCHSDDGGSSLQTLWPLLLHSSFQGSDVNRPASGCGHSIRLWTKQNSAPLITRFHPSLLLMFKLIFAFDLCKAGVSNSIAHKNTP